MNDTTIEHVSLNTFFVASASRDRLWHGVVVAADGSMVCSCEAGVGPACRHRKAVREHLATMADAIAQSLLDAEMADVCEECDYAGGGPLCPNHKEL